MMTRQHLVAAIVILVGLYDASIGLFMLFSQSPQLAHGTTTLWAHAAEAVGPEGKVILASLFARLAAFSLHAGVASIVWCATSWRNPLAISALLLTYPIP